MRAVMKVTGYRLRNYSSVLGPTMYIQSITTNSLINKQLRVRVIDEISFYLLRIHTLHVIGHI
jgi:hypothetical protein